MRDFRTDRVSPGPQNALQFARAITRHWPGAVSCLHAAVSIDDV